MSEIAPAEPRPTSVLDNARALLPEIKARAEEIEQARAVPRDLAEQLRGAGVFRRYVPRTHGGDELWPDEGLTVIEELARADASVAASVVDGAYGLSGTTGLFASCPLQRRLRDVRAVTQHYMLSARSAFGPVGTALLSEESAG
jgi:alkylation response protein AidB-like acyl-CoA dehydrogenase